MVRESSSSWAVPTSPRIRELVEDAIRAFAQRYPRREVSERPATFKRRGALDMGLGPSLRPGRRLRRLCKGPRHSCTTCPLLATGEQKAVLLLGGCLLGNVVDVDGATRSTLEGRRGRRDRTRWCHAGVRERRVTRVSAARAHRHRHQHRRSRQRRDAKIVAPGSAWPDVAIAAELAEQLGQSIGLGSVEEAARAIEETTGYPALSVSTTKCTTASSWVVPTRRRCATRSTRWPFRAYVPRESWACRRSLERFRSMSLVRHIRRTTREP
jgi:hypothetical protein